MSRYANHLFVSCLATLLACSARAVLVADFDSFNEGEVFDQFSQNGITFFGVSRHQGGYTNFAIEDASGTLFGPGFSAPNALGFGGYMPGPFAAFGAFGEMSFTAGAESNYAIADAWALPLDMGGNTVSLVGYKDGAVVNREDHVFQSSSTPLYWRFTLPSDTYDIFKLESFGPSVSGDSFLLVDNVQLDAVPEPASLLALGLAGLALARKRR
ncbi:MAG: PEP-CTERM sorting domain-containing protein [Armatimonadetes bacterium]|nr:PEP-CTERM sorting domain-containing protein [Armatimonadota bacterium]